MKLLLSIIFSSTVAVAIALTLNQDGSVTFWWAEWRIDIAFSTFLIVLLLSFSLLWVISKILFELFSLPEKARKYRLRQKENKNTELLLHLFVSYLQKNYHKLIHDSNKFKLNLNTEEANDKMSGLIIKYLTAKSADQIGNNSLRDGLLKELQFEYQGNSNKYLFVDILKLENLIQSDNPIEAKEFILKVQKKHGNSIQFLKLQIKVNEMLEEWEEVLRLTRIAEKGKSVENLNLQSIKNFSVKNLLQSASNDPILIKKIIGLIKNDYKNNSKLSLLTASAWMKIGNEKKTMEILEEFLDQHWDSQLISLYSSCVKDSKKNFKKFQQWETKFSKHHQFYLSYGKLCKHQKMWGKAQQHFIKSIDIKPSAEALVELGEISKFMKDEEAALDYWKRAAYLSSSN